MNRNIARELAVQIVFGVSASGTPVDEYVESFFADEHFAALLEENELYQEKPRTGMFAYIRRTVDGVFDNLTEIDALIEKFARGWTVNRISATARAVLRVAVYEILYAEDVPTGAAINSALEIDKGYDDADTVAFVNGVLGSFARSLDAEKELSER